MADNKFGKGVGDTAPGNPNGNPPNTKGGVPMRAAPPHPHKKAKDPHEIGAYPVQKATSNCQGPMGAQYAGGALPSAGIDGPEVPG